jgi:hypothetical protein
MERIQAAPPTGTPIRVNFVYADDTVVFDAFEFLTQTRWSFLHNSYEDACKHAESLGLADGRMRNFPLGPMNPYFSFDVGVIQPKQTFQGFFQTKLGVFQ